MQAIYKREMKSYFSSAIGYVVIATFVFFASVFFVNINISTDTPNMSGVFSNMMLVYVFIVPIITMRTFSEEKRQKTDQALLTAPVSLFGIVLGKFLAALTVYAIGMSCTVIFALIIGMSGTLDTWVVIGNLVGMLLIGAALISVGVFISSLTESQVISAIATIFILLLLFLLSNFASATSNATIQSIITSISISNRYQNFSIGIFDLSDTVFYLSMCAIFSFLTVRVLEKRRWS